MVDSMVFDQREWEKSVDYSTALVGRLVPPMRLLYLRRGAKSLMIRHVLYGWFWVGKRSSQPTWSCYCSSDSRG